MLLLIFFAFLHCWLNAFAERYFTIWRQNVLSVGAWTWATWELDAKAGKDVGEDGGYVGSHLVTKPGAFAQFSLSQTLRYEIYSRSSFFNKAAK